MFKRTKIDNTVHTCVTCGTQYRGRICNQCGEKPFHPSQLSFKSFMHEALEMFTHFENKVVKSIGLTLIKPGFITKENLRGVRVLYAKLIQLFIIVNLVFYLIVTVFKRTDYTPTIGDMGSNTLSSYPYLKWAKPYDNWVVEKISALREKKLHEYKEGNLSESLIGRQITDSAVRYQEASYAEPVFITSYTTKVSVYSKTLIFILIPVFGLIFYLLFYRKLQFYGSALVLATHFLTFNLLLHSILIIINFAPWHWFGSETFYALPFKAIRFLFYNDWMAPFSNIFLGIYEGFEAIHIIFFWIWLYVAYKRLFQLNVWQNLLLSYITSRLFFLIIFSFYKKFVIAFTLWNM